MLGFLSKLARAPWWIFAALAAVTGYFGFASDGLSSGFSVGGYDIRPVEMLLSAVPQLEPAVAWLESMGFDRKQTLTSPFGSSSGLPTALDDTPSVASRFQIFAGFFAFVAVYKLLFGARKSRTSQKSVLDDPRVMAAILKDAPGKISDEAWDNPKKAMPGAQMAGEDASEPLRISKATAAAPRAATPQKPVKARRSKGFRRRATPDAESRADRRAREDAIRSKLKSDPFERLLRDGA